jgi:hypothetical protein
MDQSATISHRPQGGVSSLALPARRLPWAALAASALLAGCVTTGPVVQAPAATGGAGGATAVGADASLQSCTEPVGTVRLQDDMASPAPSAAVAQANANLAGIQALLGGLSALGGARAGAVAAPAAGPGSVSLDSLRLLIQQSNCLLIVDRGLSESGADDEKRRTRGSNEVRDDANMGPGQEVAADFVLRSRVLEMGTKESQGFNLGALAKIAGNASMSKSVTEARVQLVLSDVRSKIQLAVSQGQGSGSNTALATNALGKLGKIGGLGGFKSESNTSGTTILLQAFADAYNKLVPAMQNYKQQVVRGGAGTGGILRVQGARSDPAGGQK